MLTHLYITPNWIVSRTARRVYLTSAGFGAALLPLIFFYFFADDLFRSPIVAMVFVPALWASIIGAAISAVAMEYFYFVFDDLSTWRKVFWFFILCLFPIGAPTYCFAVYARSKYFASTKWEGSGDSVSRWRIGQDESVIVGSTDRRPSR